MTCDVGELLLLSQRQLLLVLLVMRSHSELPADGPDQSSKRECASRMVGWCRRSKLRAAAV